ncbi:hypothetical protein DPMN_147882 [Dreissena polymorpha]|uniref:Uncharacterized protein n=1 Tax=Dreissena polymorpha TaxID=45954 RepID=A0A9D4F8I9_DREPO|nr:hypothetical protein DPMN_147882 [Dreissena polymorpha]
MTQGLGWVEGVVPTELPGDIVFHLKIVDVLEAQEKRLDDETTASSVVRLFIFGSDTCIIS